MTTTTDPLSSAPPPVPVEDVTRWHAAIAPELRAAFEACLPGTRFTLGPQLRAFEAEFAAACGAAAGIGISSGTAALTLALRALGVGPGDEVITVPNTYVATVFAITYVGALPVFVDVDPLTANLDPARLPAALTPRTKAILPVHLYGQCVDIEAIRAAAPGIPILEDAAHAHGATCGERPAGSLGELAAFSFYPSKVMGALGDGGIVTTSDPELEARLRQLRYMGQTTTKHDHLILGYQERLDELQAALLRVKLRHLEAQVAGRRRVAAAYAELLAGTPLELPAHDVTGRHVYYMYTVLAPEREALRAHLDAAGVATQLIYPRLVPDQGAYRDHPWRAADELAVARSLVPRLLCLPMFAELADAELERVGAAIRTFYGVA
jgi:dTDP-4-amino-4,6-dideoxygalactose transaminase